MMRTLITGITGFVGGHLATKLVEDGHQVWGCAVNVGRPSGTFEVADVDLLDADGLRRFVRRAAPDAVVHLGGLSHVGASFDRPGLYFRVNVLGTRNLLAAVREICPHARLVVASSAEVYGPVPEAEQPISEDRPLDPRSPYAWSKAATEVLALDAGGIVTRAFNIIGPGQAPSFALPSFARQLAAIAAGRAPAELRVGDLSSRRDFVHVADAIRAYCLLLRAGEPGTAFNLASGRAFAVGDMLDRLRAKSGVDAEVVRDEARVRPIDVPLLIGNADRLRALGWSPQHTADDALNALWQAAQSQASQRQENPCQETIVKSFKVEPSAGGS
jgi:GDP-4-dehydro-6-deoxy-D-mannose reductase